MSENKYNRFTVDSISRFLKKNINDDIFFYNPFVGITITDTNGVSLAANDSVGRITGLDNKYLVGTSLFDYVKQGLLSKSSTAMAIREKREITIEQKVSNNRSYIANSIPVFNDEGNVQYVVNFLIDSSEISLINQKLKEIRNENIQIKNEMEKLQNLLESNNKIVYRSKAMQEVMELANLASNTDASVFITGETGVGKGIMAKYIHDMSHRNTNKFVTINCEAIPKTLLESELFGYVGGAYTGASKYGRTGLFKEADEGTIFLDEIGELSPEIQVKLLDFLQYHTFRKIGGRSEEKVDVRVISATNANISKLIKEKQFRQDLYYRLNVIHLHIPPLRERVEDIPLLINFYLKNFNKEYEKSKVISADAMTLLSEIEYKGNVRELENLIERLIILSGDDEVIDLDDIEKHINITPLPYTNGSFKEQMDAFERSILEKYKEKYKSLQKIAEELDIDPSTVFRKLKKHGIK